MSNYPYNGSLYRTLDAMVDAVVENYLTAGGTNSDQTVKELIAWHGLQGELVADGGVDRVGSVVVSNGEVVAWPVETSAEALTDELLENWGPITYQTDERDEYGDIIEAEVDREAIINAMSDAMAGYWSI